MENPQTYEGEAQLQRDDVNLKTKKRKKIKTKWKGLLLPKRRVVDRGELQHKLVGKPQIER